MDIGTKNLSSVSFFYSMLDEELGKDLHVRHDMIEAKSAGEERRENQQLPNPAFTGWPKVQAVGWLECSEDRSASHGCTYTNAKVGHQIARTLLKYSLAQKDMKQARHTSQFAPMPRRNIMCQAGMTTFFSLKAKTSEVKGSVLKTPLSLEGAVSISAAVTSMRRKGLIIPSHKSDHEEGASEVAEESDCPMHQCFTGAQAALQHGDSSEEKASCAQVRSGEDDRGKAPRKDNRAERSNEPGCILATV